MGRILTSLMLVAVCLPAKAAWITFQNDTKETIVVQEIVTVNGKAVAGKPVTLQPGETLREFAAGPATKTIEVLKPGPPQVSLGKSDVTLKDKDLRVSITKTNNAAKLAVVEPRK
jgi:hypothetical protein